MRKLILLDRDGVINFESDSYIKKPSEWRPIPGSIDAIASLHQAGYLIGICSNQSAVARGLLGGADLDAIHAMMKDAVNRAGGRLAFTEYCRHHPDDACACRKPKPGMLQHAMRALGVTPAETRFVGDSLRDVQAALAARCRPILVRTGHGREAEARAKALTVLPVYDDLAAFASALLG